MEMVYTKVTPDVVRKNIKAYKKVKKAFVRWCAYKGLLTSVLSPQELKAATYRGALPDYLNIHHIVPLSSSADSEYLNSFTNLAILHKNVHKYINKNIFQPQLAPITNAPYGSQIKINIPVFQRVDEENIQICKKVLDKPYKLVYNIFVKDGRD